jgi:hypothetical protein
MTDHLTPTMRKAITQGEARKLEDRPDTIPGLRAENRTLRITNLILERKLAAAERKIEQLKASGPLAELLAEDEEPSCP